MKSRAFGLALSAFVSLAFIAGAPALADNPSVSVNLEVLVGDKDIDAEELQSAIETYLEEHDFEVSDQGDVELNITLAMDDDGTGYEASASWDSDEEAEDIDDFDDEDFENPGDAVVELLDNFVADMADGDIDGENEGEDGADE